MTGTIIGVIRQTKIALAARCPDTYRAYAAIVPSGVANSIVNIPTWIDVTVACIHFGDSRYTSYQRIDQLLGGNSRYCESEKDIGMTINVGITNSIMMIVASM